jgi:hypothetical protein
MQVFRSKPSLLSELMWSYTWFLHSRGARAPQWVRSLDIETHTSLSPIRRGFAPGLVNDNKGCTRLAATSDKVYQLLAHGRWFSPGTPASSITKTGRHDITEILLKVALKHQKSKSSNPHSSKLPIITYNWENSVIMQIHPVSEGYLRKIPVERQAAL